MKTKFLILIIGTISATLANAIDNRQFEAPLSDNGQYRNYAYRLKQTNSTIIIHTGKDYNNDKTTVVKAVGSGRIASRITVGFGDHGLGNTLVIIHPVTGLGISPVYSMYGHLASFSSGSNVDAYVSKGQQIGTMGSTGAGSNGITHLHFEFKTTNTLSNITGTSWGYISDTTVDDYTQLSNNGYRDPNSIIGNNQIAYSDFKLTNGLPTYAYRTKLFSWAATLANPFSGNSTYDVRLVLENLNGAFIGVIGESMNRIALPGATQSITFTKPSFSTPAGSYQVRLQHRGSALGGNWTTTPTPVGGNNPAMFTLY